MKNFVFAICMIAVAISLALVGFSWWNERSTPSQVPLRVKQHLNVLFITETNVTKKYTLDEIKVESFTYHEIDYKKYSYRVNVSVPRRAFRITSLLPTQDFNPSGTVRYSITGVTSLVYGPILGTRITRPVIEVHDFESMELIKDVGQVRLSTFRSFREVWNELGKGGENDVFDILPMLDVRSRWLVQRHSRIEVEHLIVAKVRRLTGRVDDAVEVLTRNHRLDPDPIADQCLEEEVDLLIALLEKNPTDPRLGQLRFLKKQIQERRP